MNDEMNWGQESSEDSAQTPSGYEHYQFQQERKLPDRQAPPQEQKPSEHWNHSFGKRIAMTISLAVIFGLVAGGVFTGFNMAAGKYLNRNETHLGTTQSVSQASDSADTVSGKSIDEIVSENGTVAGVAQASMPCVVAITTVSIQEIQSFFGTHRYRSAGSGSGIIVGENDDELLIATNNHVVEGASTLSVCFIGNDVVNAEEETQNLVSADGDINIEDAVTASIKGTDPDNDLAVVSVKKKDIPDDTMNQIKIASIGDSDELVVGEQVVAIGNALGYGQSVTSGWISALNRTITLDDGTGSDLIQTDAAINPGNSGGALLNMKGELIGINSAKYADNAVEGMGYAIPISKAQPILEELMNRETRDKVDKEKAAYMGVELRNRTSDVIKMYNMPAGAFVSGVEEGSAAQQAGVRKNDIIVKLDGQKVSDEKDLLNKLQYYAAGESVEIVVARADSGMYRETSLTLTLGSRPQTDE